MNAFKIGAVVTLLISTKAWADSLDNWTVGDQPSSGLGPGLHGVSYGNGQFVAVGDNGAILTSADDGATWVQRESGTTNYLEAVTYGGGQFVVSGVSQTPDHLRVDTTILTSADGTNWVQRWFGTGIELSAIAYGNGQFVAVGRGTDIVVASADGMNWVQRKLPVGVGGPVSIAYGGGRFVAVNPNGNTLIFEDAVNSFTIILGVFCQCNQPNLPIAYGNGHFVALGSPYPPPTNVYYQLSGMPPDGLNWVTQQWPGQSTPLAVACGGGQFVEVGNSPGYIPTDVVGHGTILTSRDGTNWVQRGHPIVSPLASVAFGNGHFVAVGFNGEILQSESIVNLELSPGGIPGQLSLSIEGSTGADYRIQSSSDLITWRDLTKITNAPSSKVILNGLPVTPGRQFYRAMSQ